MRELHSTRLRLEPQLGGHAEAMFVVLSDPAIYEFENHPPSSIEWLRDRYTNLETRTSPDGTEHWLNWVVVLPVHGPIGYVQATVMSDKLSYIAYELKSEYWGNGYGSEAVTTMLDELTAAYQVRCFAATYKRANQRSQRLLERLGFRRGTSEEHLELAVHSDESLMLKLVMKQVL